MSTRQEALDAACRRRLADGSRARWLWALAAGVPLVGMVPLAIHARSRRSLIPALYGLAALASVSFAVITIFGAIKPPGGAASSDAQPRNSDSGTTLLLYLSAMAAFSGGHRLGQDQAARQAAKWLRLDD